MAINHATIKAAGQRLFAVADWNANHIADGVLVPNLNADLLNGINSTGFIRTNGSSTTTASIPFAEGLSIASNKDAVLGENSDVRLRVTRSGLLPAEAGGNIEFVWGDGTVKGKILCGDAGSSLNPIQFYFESADEIYMTSINNFIVEAGGDLRLTTLGNYIIDSAGQGFARINGVNHLITQAIIDISADTNLAVTSPIVLTGDTLSFNFTTNNTWTGTQQFNNILGINTAPAAGKVISLGGTYTDTTIMIYPAPTFSPSAAGKSFYVFDMLGFIAGANDILTWNGNRVYPVRTTFTGTMTSMDLFQGRTLWAGGNITTFHGLNLLLSKTGGTWTNVYGIEISNVPIGASLTYAIKTGTGLVEFGDNVTILGNILTLPVKTTTGDPAGQEGAIYVNTFDNSLRLYADGAWRDVVTW